MKIIADIPRKKNNRRSPSEMTTRETRATTKAKAKCGDPSLRQAQGQDDDF
jgi:hypothetical protein